MFFGSPDSKKSHRRALQNWYQSAITLCAEISAASIVIGFWNDSINVRKYVTNIQAYGRLMLLGCRLDLTYPGPYHLFEHFCGGHLRRSRVHLCEHQDYHYHWLAAVSIDPRSRWRAVPRPLGFPLLEESWSHEGIQEHWRYRSLLGTFLHSRERCVFIRWR